MVASLRKRKSSTPSTTTTATTAPTAKTVKAKSKTNKRQKVSATTTSNVTLPKTPGQIDPASNLITKTSKLYRALPSSTPFDVMLCFVQGSSDKFYIIQVIQRTKTQYYCFTRWGRTGSKGQSQLVGPFRQPDPAIAEFEQKFEQKTGNTWSAVEDGTFQNMPKKYVLLNTNTDAAVTKARNDGIIWQYHVADGVDGKAVGWYDYDQEASDVVEGLHNALQTNVALKSYLTNRTVCSGDYSYEVDLVNWTQVNVSTKTQRFIRRLDKTTNLVVGTIFSTPATVAAPVPTQIAVKEEDEEMKEEVKVEVEEHYEVDESMNKQVKGLEVVPPYSATLNQTNIGHNNNKFYKIQLLITPNGRHYVGTRWGRLGEGGSVAVKGFGSLQDAEKEFKKKFSSKTGNVWELRDSFTAKAGKYDLIQIDTTADIDEEKIKGKVKCEVNTPTKDCTLDENTKNFIEMVFDSDMFKDAMTAMQLDVKKLPLGALKPAQIQQGYDVLEQIKTEIQNGGSRWNLERLSSRFFTVIPHCFGRQRPPILSTMDAVQQRFDFMAVLSDIEAAQELVENSNNANSMANDMDEQLPPHPTDALYETLDADLKLVDSNSKEFKQIAAFSSYSGFKLKKAWGVARHGEEERFAEHDHLDNRRLLWHGTNVAVVAAILKSGLRIMPHSGGRVGRGIYLASMQEKSAGYTWGTTWKGKQQKVMFLVEAALGKEHHIVMDDCTLKAAPQGYDSVVAKGRFDADPKGNVTIKLDGKNVVISSGTAVKTKDTSSSFHHSEYLIYKESQHRLRYVVLFE